MEMEDLMSKYQNIDFHGHFKHIDRFVADQTKFVKSLKIKEIEHLSENSIENANPDQLEDTIEVPKKELLELNARIFQYFEFMKLQQKRIREGQDEIQAQIEIQRMLEVDKIEVHQKSVKYQDMVHGFVQIMENLFKSSNMLSEKELLQFKIMTSCGDLKLTLDIEQIETCIKIMDNYNMEHKLKQFKETQTLKVQCIKTLHHSIKELRASNWLQQVSQQRGLSVNAVKFQKPSTEKSKPKIQSTSMLPKDEELMLFENMMSILNISSELLIHFDLEDDIIIEEVQVHESLSKSNTMAPKKGMSRAGTMAPGGGEKMSRTTTMRRGGTDTFVKQNTRGNAVDFNRRMTFFGETTDNIINS